MYIQINNFAFCLDAQQAAFLSMSASHYCSCPHPPHLFHRSHISPFLYHVGCYTKTSQGSEKGLRACSTHPMAELCPVQEGSSSAQLGTGFAFPCLASSCSGRREPTRELLPSNKLSECCILKSTKSTFRNQSIGCC